MMPGKDALALVWRVQGLPVNPLLTIKVIAST